MANMMPPCTSSPGTRVLIQGKGTPAYLFYVVVEGEVEVTSGWHAPSATLGPGAGRSGSVALLRDVPRTATVAATRPRSGCSHSNAEPFLLAATAHFRRARSWCRARQPPTLRLR